MPPVNGRLLTVQDIIYSYNRLRTPGWPNASLISAIAGMEALDDRTLKISLAYPDADFLFSLADGHSKIVAREAVEVSGDLKEGPNVGTGPWLWLSTEANLGSFFESNSDYYERRLPFVDKLNINVIKDQDTRLASFRAKVIDIYQISPSDWEKFKGNQSSAPSLMYKEQGVGLEVAINTARPPFDKLAVRRAAFKAFDPWKANEDVWMGNAYVSLGFPVARAEWLLPKKDMEVYFGDVDGAKQLLKGSGLELPLQVELTVGNFGDEYLLYGERIAEELRAIGIEPSITVRNVREFGQDVWYGGDYSIFVGAPPPANTPNSYLLPVFHSERSSNTAGYSNAELDKLLEEQAKEMDPQVREALILDIQRQIMDSAFRFMPATRMSRWTWWPKVQYFHPNFAASEYFHWARVWMKE